MNLDSFMLSKVPHHVSTVIFILNALNNALSITPDSPSLTFQQLILPLFLATFSGPIAANIVFKYFTFTHDAFISFFIALFLFSALRKMKALSFLFQVAPMVGKVLMIVDMKNRDTSLHLLAFWILVCNFVSIIVVKILLKKELELSENQFKDVLGTILCLAISRYFSLNDIYASIVVLLLIVVLKKDVIIKCKRAKVSEEETVTDDETRTPRRRGRPRKVDSVDGESQTPRRKSARTLNFDE